MDERTLPAFLSTQIQHGGGIRSLDASAVCCGSGRGEKGRLCHSFFAFAPVTGKRGDEREAKRGPVRQMCPL